MNHLSIAGLALALLSFTIAAEEPKADDPAVLFETRVRPILVNRCEECHAETADGDLRVDSREALLKGGESGPAIVVGDPEASLLIQAVRQTHAKLKMPKRRAKLSDAEIATLEQWVEQGAFWPEAKPAGAAGSRPIGPEQRAFWSFQPLAQPAVPATKDGAWARSDIDRFVLARMEADGLAPVAAADRPTLIRRATLDLTGLPPTPEEVAAFAADTDAEAFAKVVDRLLASPRYGEAWGRWWLDVARYGEDDPRSLDPQGRGLNPYPNAYLYRDWVVQALNDDMPYDRFVEAQLAADLMDERERAGLLPALGFLGLGPWLYDNGSVEVTRADERHDRVDAVSRGFLGLTIACARCHDHKYDPIPTEDYYSVASVFKNTVYKEYPAVPQSVVDEYQKAFDRIEATEKVLSKSRKAGREQLAQTLAFETARYLRAAWQVSGEPKKKKARVAEQEKLDPELFDRWLEFLAKPKRHYHQLDAWSEMIAQGGTREQADKLAGEFQKVLLDVMFEHNELEAENDIIRAKALPTTKPKKRANLPHEFVTNDDFCPGCGLELKSLAGEKASLWTDVFERDLDTELDLAQDMEDSGKPGVLAFQGNDLDRQLGDRQRLQLEVLRADLERQRKELPPKYAYVHGVADVTTPEPIQVHLRGSPFRLGAPVPARFPAVLDSEDRKPFTHGSGRRDLAAAIVAHPITMRVIANRIWKGHFGTGIVDTPSDFGVSGERPQDPALLEHLAGLFVEGGLSLKKFHRAILLSSVYQLSGADSERNRAVDPANRHYWRATTRRLTAEQLRDSALFVSGALDLRMGGPSEKLTPYKTRRTIYGHISRYRLDDFLALFDFPAPNATSERRFTTSVPLQRLFLMNSDFMQQQAELLAKRVEGEAGDAARIQKLYGLLFARAATGEEVAAGLAYLAAEPMKQYEERKALRAKEEAEAAADPAKAAAMAAVKTAKDAAKAPDSDAEGEAGDPPSSEPGMMAGVKGGEPKKKDQAPLPATVLGRYAKVLMSSHEFLYIR
ncbi:MAG: PSD1 and planctomycete cytochrome C domain-containing protein [Planctomycetota bacterium]|nr:PSD1 and planctomycete cytochrome C domain-containing protein [Planctomycetota bacterium]